MKALLLIFIFNSITFLGFSQNNTTDSLKLAFASNLIQQTEPLNIYYAAVYNKLIVENNTKQNYNLNFVIYDITGTPIKQYQFETLNGRSSEVPIELKSGIYIINVTDKPFSFTKKIIIR